MSGIDASDDLSSEISGELSSFLASGIYRLPASNAAFLDPVRLLNQTYTRFAVSRSNYYSRTFASPSPAPALSAAAGVGVGAARKRKKKAPRELNERERSAERRHQEARGFLVKAHEDFMRNAVVLSAAGEVMKGTDMGEGGGGGGGEVDFVELGRELQARGYEMELCFRCQDGEAEFKDSELEHWNGRAAAPLFNNLTSNETSQDVQGEFLNNRYIIPRRCSFHMSDLRQIRNLLPAHSDYGFNLIIIDPPWENGSVYQKAMYPTIPNKNLLYLPVKQFAHTEGALVVLWVTNREKLRIFVEKELFPAWGVTAVSQFYWLKVKPDGSLIGELDLFHHRPYESILLGYIRGNNIDTRSAASFERLQNNQIIISTPGAHSRKPPLGKLVSEYIPGPKPERCLELFARELTGGWTCWGNEPLRFQDSKYFVEKDLVDFDSSSI